MNKLETKYIIYRYQGGLIITYFARSSGEQPTALLHFERSLQGNESHGSTQMGRTARCIIDLLPIYRNLVPMEHTILTPAKLQLLWKLSTSTVIMVSHF